MTYGVDVRGRVGRVRPQCICQSVYVVVGIAGPGPDGVADASPLPSTSATSLEALLLAWCLKQLEHSNLPSNLQTLLLLDFGQNNC